MALQPRETLPPIFAPSISLFSKARASGRRNMNEVLHLLQTNESRKRGRSRSSVFAIERKVQVANLQNKYFPKWAKIFVFLSSLIYCLLMIITLLIHVGEYIKMTEKCKSMLSVDDVTFSVVWENGCVVKTPFCKSIFTANCESGCAAIHIRNHNLTTLPKNIVDSIYT